MPRRRVLKRSPDAELSAIERAAELAFRGRFDAALAQARRLSPSEESRWLAAYVDAARGDLLRSERVLRRFLSRPDVTGETRARAAATLGSVLRQGGRHADARLVERAALATAPSKEYEAHLWIGLAADAVGLGELRTVDAALARVGTRPAGGWRTSVRLRWVRCERELLAGRPIRAAAHARRAAEIAERAGAARHLAKSQLFLGAALADAVVRDPAGRRSAEFRLEARRALRRARALAIRTGATPIAEVAERLLGRASARR